MYVPDGLPDILQFAPANVISLEDCQQDWSFMEEQHICIRDPNGEQGICPVSGFTKRQLKDNFIGISSGSKGNKEESRSLLITYVPNFLTK